MAAVAARQQKITPMYPAKWMITPFAGPSTARPAQFLIGRATGSLDERVVEDHTVAPDSTAAPGMGNLLRRKGKPPATDP